MRCPPNRLRGCDKGASGTEKRRIAVAPMLARIKGNERVSVIVPGEVGDGEVMVEGRYDLRRPSMSMSSMRKIDRKAARKDVTCFSNVKGILWSWLNGKIGKGGYGACGVVR